MTISIQSLKPSSESKIDFGTVIKGVDLENLTGVLS